MQPHSELRTSTLTLGFFTLLLRLVYRRATAFAIVALLSISLARGAQPEDEYRSRLAALAVLLENDGDSVGIEKAGGGAETRDRIYAKSRQTLQPDEVVVEASSDSSDRDISAVLRLPTLRKLFLRDVPTGRFEEPRIDELRSKLPPSITDDEAEAALLFYRLWKKPVPPPIGTIDAAVCKISNLPLLEELDLSGTSVSDEGVRSLARARRLRVLDLSGTNITDAALEHIRSLRGLEELDLKWTHVTDKGIRYLTAFPSLRVLRLRGTNVTGAGFENLPRLRALEELELNETAITDDGVRHLAAVASPQTLDLSQTKITSRALRHLSRMKELRELSMCGDEIGGSLEPLARLPKLERLTVSGTRVSDAGLEDLVASQSLKELDLDRCGEISDAGIWRLRELWSLRKLSLFRAKRITAEGVAEVKWPRPDLHIVWMSEADYERAKSRTEDLNRPFVDAAKKRQTKQPMGNNKGVE